MDKIIYNTEGMYGGYELRQHNNNWIYVQWSREQGARSHRKVILTQPDSISVIDIHDMDTTVNNYGTTKADYIIHHGREIRCLRRGHIVQ